MIECKFAKIGGRHKRGERERKGGRRKRERERRKKEKRKTSAHMINYVAINKKQIDDLVAQKR